MSDTDFSALISINKNYQFFISTSFPSFHIYPSQSWLPRLKFIAFSPFTQLLTLSSQRVQLFGSNITGNKKEENLLKKYELLINDLYHLHNVQHGLIRYTIPFIAAAIGLTKNLSFCLFAIVIILLIIFAVIIWMSYERLDYLIALKFSRLVEIEKKHLGFEIFQTVKNPPENIKEKYKIGYIISMVKLYRWTSILTIGILLHILFLRWKCF